MMLITHATHFLSTQLMRTLNQHNFNYLVVVDSPSGRSSLPSTLRVQQRLAADELSDWLDTHHSELEALFHLLAPDDESPDALFPLLWKHAVHHQIPSIFHTTPSRTAWIQRQSLVPFFWAGLEWTQAFGPGDQGWVPQAYPSLNDDNQALTPTAQPLVYSANVAAVAYFLIRHRRSSGVHSLDPETATEYAQLLGWVKQARQDTAAIQPSSAAPASLQTLGFDQPLFSSQEGVYDYVQNHLGG